MISKVLSSEQIEQFITRGWTKVPQAFSREVAISCQDFLWDKLAEVTSSADNGARPIAKNDPSTWTRPMQFVANSYNTPPFDACATTKLADACSDIVGDGRWINQHEIGWWGWWPVNFAVGADQVWDVPADEWHIDTPDTGTYITAPDQGALMLCLFSELKPRGGGTLVCEGSHQAAVRYMKDNPGLTQNQLNQAMREGEPYLRALCGRDGGPAPGTDTSNNSGVDASTLQRVQSDVKTERIARFMDNAEVDEHGTSWRVVEVTGEPGDMILAHPFMMHSPSFNHSGIPRFMCNRKTPLFEPMELNRPDGDYSPLEESIRRAL